MIKEGLRAKRERRKGGLRAQTRNSQEEFLSELNLSTPGGVPSKILVFYKEKNEYVIVVSP